ncbi:DUF4397 domain-containing protein [Natronomonas salina]|uniref:DUF4397 domain-containing protein n=1 Tax=Natronomonas salina TaxID=1710540 RepID=UPI0015B4211E|nr:DUF4397 domain-containing protein [Natronomonas salina]QLD88325.1 DUF4397 domain-containing protein [Natronomonas salina]
MSPTRRDTLKAAGAASGLAMLGGHAVAQQGSPGSDDDNPGAQQLEDGEAGVRVGHFVTGAPAVNVRLVPADGSDGGEDTETEAGGNETNGNTTEDLQVANDSNETNDTAANETDEGLVGDNETDDSTDGGTTDGEGELIAENVSFGDVSEYAGVEAGDYTVQLVEYTEETADTEDPTDTDNTTGNTTDDNTSDVGTDDDPIISLPDDVTGGNDSEDNETGGNTSDDNTTEDLQFANDSNETNDTAGNETGGGLGGDDPASGGEVLYEEDVTVGESYYTVAATGTADDIQTLLLQDYDAAQVRLVHASPDAPAVDVVAPEASMTLFDGVTFGQGTEYVGVPPGTYSLSVREAADMNDGDEVGTADVELEAGEAYSVYAVGSPEGGEEAFQLVLEQDGQGADAGLGSDDAPGQQGGGPGQGNQSGSRGNESGGPGGDGPPGQDNDSDSPGQSGNAGGGPSADESDEADDEPGGPGGAAGPNNPGGNESGNASGNGSGTETEEDDGGLFAY